MAGLKIVGVQLVAEDGTKFVADLQRAEDAVQGFGRQAEASAGGVTKFGEIATGALRQVGAIAVEAGARAARAIAGFVGDSIGKAGDFQAGMAEFAAVTGDALTESGKSVDDFSKIFIQMGRDLPVSTGEVQQAAIELAKGGIDPATIAAGGLRTGLDLAAAGGVGLADSANILAKQLGVWVDAAASADEKSAFLTKTADLLSQAANVTTSDVSEMALGLANAGGTAKIAGLDYQELVQTMALVSPGFSSAADAGTSLKTFLSRLIPSTDKATGAMIDLGLATKDGASKFYDSNGAFIGMQAAAELLQEKTAGLSETQRLQAFQTIFGADAIRVAAMVAEKGGEGYAAMGAQMEAAGTVSEQAKARQQGYNTALENAKGSVEALQLTIGAYLLPILSTLLNDYISPGINAITTFADTFFASTDKIGFLQTALTNLGTTVGAWIMEQAPIWGAQILAWGEAFVGWVTPYIPIVVAKLGELATSVGMWIVAQAPLWLAQLVAWGEAFVGWIAPVIPPLLAKAGELAVSLWGWIAEQAPILLDKLLGWGESFVGWIAPMIPPLLAKAADLGKRFIGWIGEQAKPILAKLGEWGESLVAWIVPATKDFLGKWPGFLEQFLDWVGGAAGPLLKKLGDWAVSFIAWVLPMIPPFLKAVGGIAAALLIWVGETSAVLLKKVVTEWVPALIDWIANEAIPKLGPALQGVLDTIGGWITDAAIWVGKEVVSIGTSLVDGIKNGVAKGWDSFMGWIDEQVAKIPKAIRDFLGIHSPAQLMIPLGEAMPDGLRVGWDNKFPGLQQTVITGLRDILNGSAGTIDHDGSAAVAALERIVDSWNAAVGRIQTPGFFTDFNGGYAGPTTPYSPDDNARYTTPTPKYAGFQPIGPNQDANYGYGTNRVRPPASPAQQAAAASYSSMTTNTYHYAPTYGAAPNNPSQDFAIMQVLAR